MAFIKEAEQGLSEFEFPDDFYSPARTAQRRIRRQSQKDHIRSSLLDCQPLGTDGQESSRVGSGSYIARGSTIIRENHPSISNENNRSTSGIRLPRDYDDEEGSDHLSEVGEESGTKGGTILGIHNLSIVFPQFFISLISSLIFKHFNQPSHSSLDREGEGGAPGLQYVLLFGAVAALLAAFLTRLVPLTRRERLIREGRIHLADHEQHPEDQQGEEEGEGDDTV